MIGYLKTAQVSDNILFQFLKLEFILADIKITPESKHW